MAGSSLIPSGFVTLGDITSGDWSLMLDSTAAQLGLPTGYGQVVQGVNDINQCINIILNTPKGSDPFRPTFACDLWQYIDMPINLARPHIAREVFEALSTWEPRIELLSVTANVFIDSTVQSGAHLLLALSYQLKLGVSLPPSAVQTNQVLITVNLGG